MASVQVEFLEAEVSQSIETMIYSEFLVGKAVVVVDEGAEGFDGLSAPRMDF